MLLRELLVVDAIDHGEVGACARRRDQHALGTGGQVLGGAVAVGEAAGAFHDDVDAEIAPGKLLGIGLGKHGEVVAVGLEVTVGGAHLAGEAAMHAVELEQMGVHLGRAEIVDRDEIEILAAALREKP